MGGVQIWSYSFSTFCLAGSFGIYWARRLMGDIGRPFPASPMLPGFAVFAGLFALSALFSEIPSKNLLESYKLASAALAFIACVALFPQRRDLRMLATALSLLGGVLSLAGLLQYVGALPHDWWDRPFYLSSVYVNHNHFAGLLEIVLPVSLALLLVDKDAGKKTLLLFLNAVMAAAFALTLSRGGYVAIAVGLGVFTLLIVRRGSMGRLAWILALACCIGLLLSILDTGLVGRRLSTLKSAADLSVDMSFQQRLFIWRTALQMIAAHPWLGTGPGTFAFSFLRHQSEDFHWRPVYAHNDYLNLAADLGIPAALALLTGLGYFAWRVLGGLRTEESRTRAVFAAAGLGVCASYAVHSLSDFNLHIPANLMLFAAVLGMMNIAHTGATVPSRKLSIGLNLAVAALIAFVLLAGFRLGIAHYYFFQGQYSAAILTDPDFSAAHAAKARTLEEIDPKAAASGYERARALNALEPNFDLWYIECFRRTTHRGRGDELIPAYERMLAKQPASAVLRYLAAQRVMESNPAREPSAEAWALRQLREAVRLDAPTHAPRTLDLLWVRHRRLEPVMAFAKEADLAPETILKFLERNDLWKYHRAALVELEGMRPHQTVWTGRVDRWAVRPDDEIPLAQLVSDAGRDIYKDGYFYASGSVHTRVKFHAGEARLRIRASATPAKGVHPYLIVKVDGRTVNTHYVDMRVPVDYYSLIETEPGVRTLTLEFANDAVDEKTGRDRNIRIEKIELQYPEEDHA